MDPKFNEFNSLFLQQRLSEDRKLSYEKLVALPQGALIGPGKESGNVNNGENSPKASSDLGKAPAGEPKQPANDPVKPAEQETGNNPDQKDKPLKAESIESDRGEESKRPWWKFENRSSYSVLRNYIIASGQKIDVDGSILRKDNFDLSVTYTTQGSYEFLQHAEQLCKRFDGPVSIAVYAPSSEFQIAVNLIYYLRECGHPCVRHNISWHMIYDTLMKVDNLDIHKYPDEFLIDNNVNLNFNCSVRYKDYMSALTSIYDRDGDRSLNVRAKNHLPYPINVLRNVARLSANTKYVLASDIELYPSTNIVRMFRKMLAKEKKGQLKLVNAEKPHVYILPIFEVEVNVSAPETKLQLVQMLKKGTAIPFHKWVCDACQNFVDREKWPTETVSPKELNIFRSTKRKKTYWEPLYIGTNDEPLYDERLSWDGKRDKMSQVTLERVMAIFNLQLPILNSQFH